MSLIDFAQERGNSGAAVQTNANGRRQPRLDRNGQPLPDAKLWLNIGYMQGDRFVNLPLGLAIDTMQPLDVRGSNQEWLKFTNARNALLEAIQGLSEKLAPGDEVDIPNLIIKVRRVTGEVAIEGENPFETDLGALLSGGTVVNPGNERAMAEAQAAG